MELTSKKIEIKNKFKIMWIIVAIIVFITLCFSIFDYVSYKQGQKFGLEIQRSISKLSSDAAIVDTNDGYKNQCNSLYNYFTDTHPDITIYGTRINNSALRESLSELKELMADMMKSAGYDRYSADSIANWFKYTSLFEYFFECLCFHPIFIVTYIVLLLALALTIVIYIIRQKELVVTEKMLICKYSKKKSKQIVIKDVIGVENTQKSLMLSGNGFKFRISLIANAEELKAAIMQKKDEFEKNYDKITEVTTTSADELKKYKDLLDSGVITQEEFDEKKKQLLGL